MTADFYHTDDLSRFEPTVFTGYDLSDGKSRLSGILFNGEVLSCLSLEKGQECQVILEISPFFSERPYQVSDTGRIYTADVNLEVYLVRNNNNIFIHYVRCLQAGNISSGEEVFLSIDTARRDEVSRHHTALHLLIGVMEREFEREIKPVDFSVSQDRLEITFPDDFSVEKEKLPLIERKVYSQILLNKPVITFITTEDKVLELKGKFCSNSGRKEVRVAKISDISCEICEGTHCMRTGNIGIFKIVNHLFDNISGLEKLEAVAGVAAYNWIEGTISLLEVK